MVDNIDSAEGNSERQCTERYYIHVKASSEDRSIVVDVALHEFHKIFGSVNHPRPRFLLCVP